MDELNSNDCDLWMLVSFLITLLSTCNQKAGCVIFSKEKGLAGLGWSGAPSGHPHCTDKEVGCDIDKWDMNKRCKRAITAVKNAIIHSNGEKLTGAEVFITRRPEERDLIILLKKGVKKIHYDDERIDLISENRLIKICKEENAVISKTVFDLTSAFARHYAAILDNKGLKLSELRLQLNCRGNGEN